MGRGVAKRRRFGGIEPLPGGFRVLNMRYNARIVLVSGMAAALLAGAGACSSSGSSGKASSPGTTTPPASSAPAAPAAAATITITNFVFTGPTTVSPGATVAVTNTDSADHTVTSDGLNQFDVQAPAGKTVTFTAPTAPGTYPFHCSIHPNMHGSLIVK